MRAVTVATRSYLARGVVLARSLRATNPGWKQVIVLVDGEPGEFESTDDYTIRTLADLPLDAAEAHRMALIYDPSEFSNSLKPWALQMILDEGDEFAAYIDSDVMVFGSMDPLERLAAEHQVVLTPHTIHPMPRDGLQPDETIINRAGTFNAGCITVSHQGRPVLEWLQERLRRDCVVDYERVLFFDQGWWDLAPGFFDVAVLRDPGFNVAYWNLHERAMERVGGVIMVGDSPLRFFHFSGFDPRNPWMLTKHLPAKPRVPLSENPLVAELCDQYRRSIESVEEELTLEGVAYGFGRLGDGTEIGPGLRAAFRELLAREDDDGIGPVPKPFDGVDANLISWLSAPLGENGFISRYLFGVWASRADLKAEFPYPLSSREFLNWVSWATTSTEAEPELAATAKLWARQQDDALAALPVSPLPGINLGGSLDDAGSGPLSRMLSDAAAAAGVETVRDPAVGQPATRHPLTVVVPRGDQLMPWLREHRNDYDASATVAVAWSWELEACRALPELPPVVDELWAPSEYARNALSNITRTPVAVVPLPVEPVPADAHLERGTGTLPDTPFFLHSFDHDGSFERANPLAVIEAFIRAFPEAGPSLVIRAANGHRHADQSERLRYACRRARNVYLVEDDRVATTAALIAESAAYVSLHRWEEFGLDLATAMASGKPAIVTAFGGILDYSTPDNCLLVGFTRESAPQTAPLYPGTTEWVEPDIASAAVYMRWVNEKPGEAAALGNRARASLKESHSLARTAQFLRSRLEPAMRRNDPTPPADGKERRPTTVLTGSFQGSRDTAERAREMIHTPPNVDTPSRLPRASRKFRQVVYRVLAHHDEHVNERLDALSEALSELLRAVDNLTAEQSRSLAEHGARLDAQEAANKVTEEALDELRRLQAVLARADSVRDERVEEIGRALVRLAAELDPARVPPGEAGCGA
jgi:glycosyltransferase involved in cell wall biosynthesis